MREIIENAIRECVNENMRKTRAKQHMTLLLNQAGASYEWKANDEFHLPQMEYGYKLTFNKGGICRGFIGKDFSNKPDLLDWGD